MGVPSVLAVAAVITALKHTRSTQSVPTRHFFLSAHAGAPSVVPLLLPPQSTSVSLSLATPSVSDGSWHEQVWPAGQSIGLPFVLAVAGVIAPV
jgi:hypothetical protein